MKNKIDNILMGILWLVAAILGTCFWFNTQFGFNIFSGAHWRHLAYMQAVQQPIKPAFYISLVFAVIITIAGLYVLLRPRKVNTPTHKSNTPSSNSMTHAPQPTPTPSAAKPAPLPAASNNATPPQADAAPTPQDVTAPTSYEPQMSRPMRLNISPAARNMPPPPQAPTLDLPTTNTAAPQTSPAPYASPAPTTPGKTQEWPELREIFESTGYTVKPNIFINGVQTALIAIGADENLWIGAVGVTTTSLKSVVEKFERIFEETLEEIIINISGFVISAPDAASPGAPEILTFDTPGALREYMNNNRNPELDSDEQENFDAYSNYISTVLEYLGKL